PSSPTNATAERHVPGAPNPSREGLARGRAVPRNGGLGANAAARALALTLAQGCAGYGGRHFRMQGDAMKSTRIPLALAATLGLLASAPVALVAPAQAAPQARVALANAPFAVAEVQRFDSPWAMTFLPDGRLLVTEMAGNLRLFDPASGKLGTVAGVPTGAHGGQGGLAAGVPRPGFAGNRRVYISDSEAGGGGTAGAAAARARLVLDQDGGGRLDGLQVIWRQQPKVSGQGHFGQRIAFGSDGKLWISSSERQKFDPAQDMKTNLGKMIRLDDDGSVPADNPFADQGGVAAQVWTLGHRNILGVAFDGEGRLWAHEMGPKGGDELNLIERGANYGYPVVSNGDHYDG